MAQFAVLKRWEGCELSEHHCTVQLDQVHPPTTFYRAVEDHEVTFGGGQLRLHFPLLVCPQLPLPADGFLDELAAAVWQLGDARNDVQQNGIVHDIVDPDFYPRLLQASERKVQRPLK